MRIQHNLAAMNALNNYANNNKTLTGNLEKLSSGYRINSAADDAAGLAISEKMRSQIAGLEKAQDNANDGISLIQTAEGALTEVNSMLTRLTELATQSANGTYDDEVDRVNIQEETNAILDEIDRISKATNYNGIELLDGSLSGASSVTTTEEITGTPGSSQINAGITIGKAVDGTGSKGEYTIDLKGALGQGDLLQIDYVKADGTTPANGLKFERYDSGDATVKKITGDTVEAQAESLKTALNAELSNDFDISVDGSKITLKAKKEGLPSNSNDNSTKIASIIGVTVTDKSITSNSTVQITTAFADTNTIAFAYNDADGQAQTLTLTGKENPVNATDFAIGDGTDLGLQADNIAATLNNDENFSSAFNVKVDGDKLIFEAKSDKASLTSSTPSGGSAAVTTTQASTTTAQTTTAATKMEHQGITKLVNDDSDYKVGDVLTFKFNIEGTASAAGTAVEADVEITEDMFKDGKLNTKAGTEEIVNALKDAHFKDVYGTLTDESQYKVSDFFDITANEKVADGTTDEIGSVHISGKDKAKIAFTGVTLTAVDGRTAAANGTGTAVTGGSAGTTAISGAATNLKSDTDISGPNFSAGDKFKLTGVLHDGQKFEIELEANKDFAIGATTSATLTNIKDVLEAGIYNNAGKAINATVDGKEVNTAKLFGSGNEFSLSVNTNKFTVTSNREGAEYDLTKTPGENAFASGGHINVTVTPASEASVESKFLNGTAPTSGHTSITFEDGKVGYGSAIKIADKTFEFVEKAEDVSNPDNVAVVIEDIANATGDDIANALENIINDENTGLKDTLSAIAVNGKLNISTVATGSDVVSPEVSLVNGTKINNVSYQFKPEDMEVGKQFEVNGETFQIYQSGKPPVESEEGINYIALDLKNEELSSKDIADAVASKINSDENLSKKISASVADDGTITFASKEIETDEETGATKFKDSSFKMTNTKTTESEGKTLILQVGDTNDDYQKVSVQIEDMSSKGLGLRNKEDGTNIINLGNQDSAGEAIDIIKAAVNKVSTQRGKLGALQNRLDHTLNNLAATDENITAAESQIRDTNMAQEMTQYSKNNILAQAAQSMLAQANSMPQGVLQLLQ